MFSGNLQLDVRIGAVANVSLADANDNQPSFSEQKNGPNVFPDLSSLVSLIVNESPQSGPNLGVKLRIGGSVGPGSQYGIQLDGTAATLTLRNAGTSDATVPLNYLLVLNGLTQGPDAAQIFGRSRIQSRVSGGDWTTIFEAVLDLNSAGPVSSLDYCAGSQVCEGQVNVIVGANSPVELRLVGELNGEASQGEVPEPSAMVLAGAGLGFVVWLRRRRQERPRWM